MTNLHTPERQSGESQAEYRARQKRSKDAVQCMSLTGKYHPRNGVVRGVKFTAWDPQGRAEKSARRDAVKAAGGIRQFKRQRQQQRAA